MQRVLCREIRWTSSRRSLGAEIHLVVAAVVEAHSAVVAASGVEAEVNSTLCKILDFNPDA